MIHKVYDQVHHRVGTNQSKIFLKMSFLFQKKQFELQQWFELMLEYSSLENENIPAMICEFIIYMYIICIW